MRHLVKRAIVFKDGPKPEIVKTPAGFLPNFTAEYMIRYFYFADMKDSQYEDVTLASQVASMTLFRFYFNFLVLCEPLASCYQPSRALVWPNEVFI